MTATLSGNDVFEGRAVTQLRGKSVGVITNHSGLDSRWMWLPEKLKAAGVKVEKLFSPEHGPYGVAKEGQEREACGLR